MCRWSKEEFDTREIRDNIPFGDFRKCGEDIRPRDTIIRSAPDYRSTPEREVIPLSEQKPTPAPEQPIATAQPPGSASVGLIMLGAGVGLFGWLIYSALHPKSNHQPAHQNPTE